MKLLSMFMKNKTIKEGLINYLTKGDEPDIIIYRSEYDNQPYVVSYFSDYGYLRFCITHIPDGKRSELFASVEEGVITINDIRCTIINNGYGTVLVSELINYAKENEVKTIVGWISNVDNDHMERLVHFYSKFGFEILPTPKDKPEGLKLADIILRLE